MKSATALRYFKTKAELRRKAGVSKQAVTQWFQRKDGLVPLPSAFRLHVASNQKLALHPEHYKR